MRIIFDYRILTHKNYTGVENYAHNILKFLQKNIDVNISKSIITNRYFSNLWSLLILMLQKGDVIFYPTMFAPLVKFGNKKVVTTIHDIAFITQAKSFSIFFQIYYKYSIKRVIKKADRIITVSNFSKKEIEKYFPKSIGKINVIHLGMDSIFRPMNNIEKKNQILYVGSLNERKNFIGVLKAFDLLNKNEYKLVIVGNFFGTFNLSNEAQEYINRAKNNPNIEFKHGVSNEELVTIYNQSKLFLFPSFYEGFGLPVLESMSCGTPVICSNISSLPEVGGDAVIYCNPYDIDDIKNKMELVLNDENLQIEMIQKGLNRSKLFSWEKSTQEHIKIFKELFQS